MRDQFKCSECRRKKIKCTPRNRQWETTHQKCDNCKKYDDAPCGPSYKKKDDPLFPGLRNEVNAQEEDSTRDAEDQSRARTVHSAGYFDGHNEDEISLVTEESNGQRERKSASDKRFDGVHEEARSRLQNLNSLGSSYTFGSELPAVYCCNRDNPIKYNKRPEDKMKTIGDGFHLLFVEICQLGLQLHKRGMDNEACRIFMDLMIALVRYPGLCDDRKYGALCEIANFYLDIGDQDIHEWVLTKATEAHDTLIDVKDPCPQLANSLTKTSRRAENDLRKLWEKQMAPVDTSLAIPPIQRSAQHRNAGVALALLAHPNSIAHSRPALFNQEALHIAATRNNEQNLKILLRAGAQVDAPDIHNHTALSLAAAKGHERCCAELIDWGADVNGRNIHGTTILEVAAGAGHIKVVQQLVNAGAEVNPSFKCCTSSPLQAAIENPQSPLEVALYLIGKNGDVSIRRNDGKNAIDLAEKRCGFLAGIMRQKEQLGPQGFFDPPQAFSFDQRHLLFGPSLP